MVELLNGRYRIGEPIGAGGSARVFRARDERLGRDVAVKLLDDEAARSADPAARQRFEQEARAGARFVHPNAVTVFDAGADQDRLFLVMELVSGGSLAERLARFGPMDAASVSALGAQIGAALAAGHAAGLLHRDVKPSNVLFSDDGTALLADFGIARRFDEIEDALTDTGMVMGTRQYVSPEQAAGRELTAATDQFSLGVTLFEAVTATRPPSAVERAPDHVLEPDRLVAGIPAGLVAVIATATAMPVERRFDSMSTMVDSLSGATGAAPFARTVPLASGAEAERSGPPRPGAAMSNELATERRRRRIGVGAALVAAVTAIGIIAVAAAGGDDNPDAGPAGSPVTASVAPTDVGNAPTTVIATTASTTSTAVTTTTSTTTPTTVPATTIAELIAGFPLPSDEQDFLATLRSDPDLAGRRGDDLAKRFERVLTADPDDRVKEADRLRREIDKWVDKDEIEPTIATTAAAYLDELAPASDDSDNSENSDDR